VSTLVVIPARFASTRFPGKPLAVLAGKPMIQHVWERSRAAGLEGVIVATEDKRILDACREFGADVELTSAEHASGTDRVAEVAKRHPEYNQVLNVQGDEPGIPAETVRAVADALRNPSVNISTAVAGIRDPGDLSNPNVVKVVMADSGAALYFSRAGIPFRRDANASAAPPYFRHLGIYGFQRDILLKVTQLKPSPLELTESLEQLRWLQAGYRIQCAVVKDFSVGVDTPADLKAFEMFMQTQVR